MNYQYTAKAASGGASSGTIEAHSESEARQQLRQQGLFPLSMNTERQVAVPRSSSRKYFGRRVSKNDLLMLTSQLAIMCRSGIDLAEALKNAAKQCANPTLKKALDEAYSDVSDGKAVSVALNKHPHIFGNAYVASIAAGEASGCVPDVLTRLGEMLRNEIRLRSTLRSVLSYPIVLILVASMVLSALIFFVLPQFSKVFESMETPAPPFTQFLLDTSLFIREHSVWLGVLLAGTVFALFRLLYSETARRYWDDVLLNTVLIRDATRALLTGRTFCLLGTMLESGVPLLEAIQLCRSSVKNTLYRELFDMLEHDVLNGRGMGHALASTKIIPPGAAQMVLTAEQSGKLAQVMQTVGEFYEEDGERRVRESAKLLEPAIIVMMGFVVAVVVMSVMLPLLDFSTLSSQH